MVEKERKEAATIFVVRTTAGQERNVAEAIEARVNAKGLPIYSILAPETLRGYVFIEALGSHTVDEAIAGIKHAKSHVPGVVGISNVEKFLITKPVIEELSIGDTVEITGGPFKDMKAKIVRVDKVKEEVTIELLEAAFTLPITVHADYVKLLEKSKSEEEKI
ncbi:MAG: transcription elongation factor Spt5 [Candidatus Bathyarchaeota archaeon]|nr:transcription elongation factor Spt5 [Candidatus Bathyarchaeota archaeon]